MNFNQPEGTGNCRLLVVEDERDLSRLITLLLEKEGFAVDCVFDGVAALEQMEKNYDLIILDLGLPLKSGFEVLQTLRMKSIATPVLIMSSREKLDDRLRGFRLGADDFLVKPFFVQELAARVRAILQRSGNRGNSVLQVGELKMDVVHRRVFRQGKEIVLTPKEFALLEILLRNKNKVVDRAVLIREVWGAESDQQRNCLDVHMSHLRAAMNAGFSGKLISTIHGEGYILQGED